MFYHKEFILKTSRAIQHKHSRVFRFNSYYKHAYYTDGYPPKQCIVNDIQYNFSSLLISIAIMFTNYMGILLLIYIVSNISREFLLIFLLYCVCVSNAWNPPLPPPPLLIRTSSLLNIYLCYDNKPVEYMHINKTF